jgi:hypothetical protein
MAALQVEDWNCRKLAMVTLRVALWIAGEQKMNAVSRPHSADQSHNPSNDYSRSQERNAKMTNLISMRTLTMATIMIVASLGAFSLGSHTEASNQILSCSGEYKLKAVDCCGQDLTPSKIGESNDGDHGGGGQRGGTQCSGKQSSGRSPN